MSETKESIELNPYEEMWLQQLIDSSQKALREYPLACAWTAADVNFLICLVKRFQNAQNVYNKIEAPKSRFSRLLDFFIP